MTSQGLGLVYIKAIFPVKPLALISFLLASCSCLLIHFFLFLIIQNPLSLRDCLPCDLVLLSLCQNWFPLGMTYFRNSVGPFVLTAAKLLGVEPSGSTAGASVWTLSAETATAAEPWSFPLPLPFFFCFGHFCSGSGSFSTTS